MAQLSFCCANSRGYLLDRHIAEVNDFLEAREYAKEIVWWFLKTAHLHDWRSCRLHVRDQNGKDIFVMPFPWAYALANWCIHAACSSFSSLYRSPRTMPCCRA